MVLNEFMGNIKKAKKGYVIGNFVKLMIGIIKDSCNLQLQLEAILDIPIKLCNLIKTKGKKLLSDNLSQDF